MKSINTYFALDYTGYMLKPFKLLPIFYMHVDSQTWISDLNFYMLQTLCVTDCNALYII